MAPSIEGVHVATLEYGNRRGNTGLVLSRDGGLLAVCGWTSHQIEVYNLYSGMLEEDFGGGGTGPGQFQTPQKMCLSPLTGNLLIADGNNRRVQVCPARVCTVSMTPYCRLIAT